MEIDKSGFLFESAPDTRKKYLPAIKTTLGSDFTYRWHGLIDACITVLSYCHFDFQQEIGYFAQQFNPDTAVDKHQAGLYERVGLQRIDYSPSQIEIKLTGTPNLQVPTKGILINNQNTDLEFINNYSFKLDNNGVAIVTFECDNLGALPVNKNDTFEIVSAPAGITSIEVAENANIIIGNDYESNKDFRKRFKKSLQIKKQSNRDGLINTLVQYVAHPDYLKILDPTLSTNPGFIKIIAHHNTTDENFAKAIFECIAFGIKTLGDTTINISDLNGNPVPISFQKAEKVPIYIKANIKTKSGFYKNSVITNVKNNIYEYIKQRVYGLECSIYATEFTIPILKTDGVEAVHSVKIKSSSNEDFSNTITLSSVQVPEFQVDRIDIYENL